MAQTLTGTNTAIPGWMGPECLTWLYETASRYQSVVEIGCWMGRSTYALLSGCTGKVWAVDHFLGSPSELDDAHAPAKAQDIYAAFLGNVGHFPNLEVLRMTSAEASYYFEDRAVEMVFLDADHQYDAVVADLRAWEPKCSKMLCGHDIDRDEIVAALETTGIRWNRGPGTLWHRI